MALHEMDTGWMESRGERRARKRQPSKGLILYERRPTPEEVASHAPNQLRVELSRVQLAIYNDPKRFRLVIAGRRSGKTVEAIAEVLAAAYQSESSLVYYVAPTYRMARDIAWELLLRMCPRSAMAKEPNETRLEVVLLNGTRIALRGADKPSRLKGTALVFVVLDEFAQMKPEVWSEVLLPQLTTTGGRALFITTPAGYNHAYQLYTRAQTERYRAAWGVHQYTTAEGGWVPPEELELARGEMDTRTFAQEFEASFQSLKGRVYPSFELANVDPAVEDPRDAVAALNRTLAARGSALIELPPLYVGMDFNVNPMTWVVGYRRARNQLDVIDAGQEPYWNTEKVALHLRAKYGPERRIIVCPDPYSSLQTHTNAPAGETDITILRRHGLEVLLPDVAPRVVDRINAVNGLLKSADGTRRLRVHPRAEHLINALNGLTYKDSRPDPKSPFIHITDALGYLVWQEFNTLQSAAWLSARLNLTKQKG